MHCFVPQSQYDQLDFETLKTQPVETMLCSIGSEYLLTEAEVNADVMPVAYKTKFTWSASKRNDIDEIGQWGWAACLPACGPRAAGLSARAHAVHVCVALVAL